MNLWILCIAGALVLPAAAMASAAVKRDRRLASMEKEPLPLASLEKEGIEVWVTNQKDWLLTPAQPARFLPGKNKNGKLAAVAQKEFAGESDRSYLEPYLIREGFRRRKRMQRKAAAGLLIPVWAIVSGLIWLYQISGLEASHPFLINIAAPFGAVALLTVCLLLWNGLIGRQEQQADQELLRHYTPKQVKDFIVESEKREKKAEKTRAFDEHYLQKRLSAVEACSR